MSHPAGTTPGVCRGCGQRMLWALTITLGRRMPLDPAPSPQGNVRLVEGGAEVLGAATAAEARAAGEELYASHFATCPTADRFRAQKG